MSLLLANPASPACQSPSLSPRKDGQCNGGHILTPTKTHSKIFFRSVCEDDREYDIQCPRSAASRDHFGEFSFLLWQPIVMSPPPSYGKAIWLLGTSDKKFAVSRRGSRDLARSLAALVGYLPTHSTPPGAMGNSKAGGVEESNLGDRTTLLNPFDTGQRTHCGGWECSQLTSVGVISAQVRSLSLGFYQSRSIMLFLLR